MKNTLILMTSVLALGTAGYAYAQSGTSMADQWVLTLEQEGYTHIEVEEEDGEIEIEGVKDGMEREITLDAATGDVLSDETEVEDEDGNDEDDEDDV